MDKYTSQITPYQRKLIKGGKGLMGGAAIFVGATTLIDTALTVKERQETRQQVKQQEKNLEEDQKRQKERRKKGQQRRSMFHDTPQSLVFGMFENRSGHHKMGNNKFSR